MKAITKNKKRATRKNLKKKLSVIKAAIKNKKILTKNTLKKKWIKIKKISRTTKIHKSEKIVDYRSILSVFVVALLLD
jgi:hypothetical protein